MVDLDVTCARSEHRPAIPQAESRDLGLLTPGIGISFEHFFEGNKCILKIFEKKWPLMEVF